MTDHQTRAVLAALLGAADFIGEARPGTADRLTRALAVARRVRRMTGDRAERRGAWSHCADAVRRLDAELGALDLELERAAARVVPWGHPELQRWARP